MEGKENLGVSKIDEEIARKMEVLWKADPDKYIDQETMEVDEDKLREAAKVALREAAKPAER